MTNVVMTTDGGNAQEAEFANFRRFPKAAVQPKDSECRVSA